MKLYFAELIELTIDWLCALTNHAHGCWVANHSPLARLHWWAVEVRDPIGTHRNQKAVVEDDPPCSYCGVTSWTTCTASTYSYCGSCGRTKKLA